jgi:hypothetical protein
VSGGALLVISAPATSPTDERRRTPVALGHPMTFSPEGGSMARDAKKLRVTLQALRCTTANGDSGTNLEIFGKIEARGVFIDGEGQPQPGFHSTLWEQRGDDGGINIAPATEIVVNKTANFVVFERDFLWLGGKIVEEDDFDDDILGDGFRIIGYDNIKPEMINVGFKQDEQEILARFTVEVLGIEHHPEA